MLRAFVAFAISVLSPLACTTGIGEGGMGLPVQRDGESYLGPRGDIRGTLRVADSGCIELETGDQRWFVIWPSGSRLDAFVRLPDGTVLDEGDDLVGLGGATPVAPLVAAGGYWTTAIGFCARDAREVLVLDEVTRAEP